MSAADCHRCVRESPRKTRIATEREPTLATEEALTKKLRFAACVSMLMAACAADSGNEQAVVHDEDVGLSQQALKTGFASTTSPFVVGLNMQIPTPSGFDAQYVCTGIVLNPNWILTAGHCLEQSGFQYNSLEVFKQFGSNLDMIYSDTNRADSRPFLPSNWKAGGTGTDVGLIHLGAAMSPAPSMAEVARIYSGTATPQNASTSFRITGWGFGNLTNVETCSNLTWLQPRGGWFTMNNWGTSVTSMLQPFGQEVCEGDSGSAIYNRVNNDWTLTFGLIANFSALGATCNGRCAANNAAVNGPILGRHLDWAVGVSQQTSHPFSCFAFSTTATNGTVMPYRRCM